MTDEQRRQRGWIGGPNRHLLCGEVLAGVLVRVLDRFLAGVLARAGNKPGGRHVL